MCASSSASTADVEIGSPSRNAPSTAAGPPPCIEPGRRRDTEHQLTCVFEPDQRRPDGQPAHVALGAVDGIDDPAELGIGRRTRVRTELLTEHGMTGRVREPLPDRALNRLIRFAHGREIGLRRDLQVDGAEPRHRDFVGRVGELEREIQVRGDVHRRSIRSESPDQHGMVRVVPSDGETREALRALVAQRVRELADETVEAFVDTYFTQGGIDDLTTADADHLAHAAIAHWQFGAHRPPRTAIVQVHTPTVASEGWDAPHTSIDVVNDDMPFLVDSITMAIDRHDLGIHLVVHPVLDVQRAADGALVGLDPLSGGTRESWVHLEVDRETSPEILDAVRTDLERVLGDVRAATGDWLKMLATLDAVDADLGAMPPAIDDDDLAEGRAFLRWMADQHFTFLGYRKYDLEYDAAGGDVLRALPGTGLGILRARAGETDGHTSASFSKLPPAIRAKAREKNLLVLTKANARSTVHRPAYLDYVGVKRYDDAGNVIGEHRFLGLYTSSAYTGSPIDIPVLRRKVSEAMSRAQFAPASHDYKDLIAILESFPRDDLFQISARELFDIAMGILALQERRRVPRVRAPRAVRALRVVPGVRAPGSLQHDCSHAHGRSAARRVRRVQLRVERPPLGVSARSPPLRAARRLEHRPRTPGRRRRGPGTRRRRGARLE